MRINLMSLILFALVILVIAVMLSNPVLGVAALAMCAGVAYLVAKIMRIHRSDDQNKD